MRFVVDSSVAVKWLVDEDDASLARPFLELEPTAPDFLVVETANVLWKKARKGEISESQAANAARLLTDLRLPLWGGPDLSQRALTISFALDHASYDCFYLALAERLAIPFLTADAKLVGKVARSELVVDAVLLAASASLLEKAR